MVTRVTQGSDGCPVRQVPTGRFLIWELLGRKPGLKFAGPDWSSSFAGKTYVIFFVGRGDYGLPNSKFESPAFTAWSIELIGELGVDFIWDHQPAIQPGIGIQVIHDNAKLMKKLREIQVQSVISVLKMLIREMWGCWLLMWFTCNITTTNYWLLILGEQRQRKPPTHFTRGPLLTSTPLAFLCPSHFVCGTFIADLIWGRDRYGSRLPPKWTCRPSTNTEYDIEVFLATFLSIHSQIPILFYSWDFQITSHF